jgi:UDP-N-acetylglucosamine/UDP-N-acetylgalactosamine diphosphorylase
MEKTDDLLHLIDDFKAAGQGQVFQYFDGLDADAKSKLLAQAATIDLSEVDALVKAHVNNAL